MDGGEEGLALIEFVSEKGQRFSSSFLALSLSTRSFLRTFFNVAVVARFRSRSLAMTGSYPHQCFTSVIWLYLNTH